MKHIYTFTFIFLFTGVGLLSSCKKEYETAPTPYNEITSFKVSYLNGQDSIEAIMDGETIHIVWPGSSDWPIPATVQPKITVSANASIFPASNTAISLQDGTTYTVTAQDGSAKTYTIKITNGAALPAFANEDPISIPVGGTGSVSLLYTAADGSDSLFLVNDAKQEFKVIQQRQYAISGIEFIADQPSGTGIPAGEYYVKIVNKYRIPVMSSSKRITITDAAPMPYIYFNHTQSIEVKRGGTLTVPVRHFGAAHGINRVRFYYMNASTGDTDFVTLTYSGTNATHDQVSFQIPLDAPIGITLGASNAALQTRITYNGSNLTTNSTGYYPYAIKIVE